MVERDAGLCSGFTDDLYVNSGATVVDDKTDVFSKSDVVLFVRAVGTEAKLQKIYLDNLHSQQVLIGFLDPLTNPKAISSLSETGVTAFAMELIPRISRAQGMDALTSMATISGYKAVLLAAEKLPKIFPMLVTAAGTLTPTKVFVIGAGVAGLQAIATAKRLGGVVQAYDIRPVAKEQVESVGAKFVELPINTNTAESGGGYAKSMGEEFYKLQRELMTKIVSESDVVISTAAVPGKKPPILVTKDMVENMQTGSVIVDLATELGGNCELTQPGETLYVNGVTIIGATNLPTTVPYHASRLYSGNVVNFLNHIVNDGQISLNFEDEIVKETLLTTKGGIVHPKILELLNSDATKK